MHFPDESLSRRTFINCGLTAAAGLALPGLLPQPASAYPAAPPSNLLVIGPLAGYTPHVGTLVSMLNYNRDTIVGSVKGMTAEQLDFLIDPHANTIGALLLHLAATEKYYQINSFEGRQDFNDAEKKEWGAAMELSDTGRKEIKGHDLQFYLDKLAAVRAHTLEVFKNKDDVWLMAVDPVWSKPNDAVNTYWKWFHVCEHESNHRGQITWQKSRLPGAKWAKE